MARVQPSEERPLDRRTIVVTRAAAQAQRFTQLLEAAGARVLEAPAIVIAPPSSWEPLDSALAAVETYTWIIFTSVNGVAMVDRRLAARGLSWSTVSGRRVAAIGPATADALAEHGARPDVVPGEYRAEGLVERLRAVMTPADRVLLPRAAQTRDVLVTELRRLGAHVDEVPAYTTRRGEGGGTTRLREALAAGTIDAVTFTSSSTARNFAELFSEDERRAWLSRVTVASIGPITAATAAEYGMTTDVMPNEYTIPALAKALADYFARVPHGSSRAKRRGRGEPSEGSPTQKRGRGEPSQGSPTQRRV